MYKAGDFTNGKMNDIFSTAYSDGAVDISHKQFGSFKLINKDESTHYLLSALELTYGISYEKVGSEFILSSLLSVDEFAIGVGTDYQMNADYFTAESLLAGLFYLSDKHHKPKANEDFVAQTLTRLILNGNGLLNVNNIDNCNKKEVLKSIKATNNALSMDKVKAFLDLGIGTNKHKIYLATRNAVKELAINSIQHNVIDGDVESRGYWNMHKFCLVYFNVTDELGGGVNQESVYSCLEHLRQEGAINYISEDEFEIAICSSTI